MTAIRSARVYLAEDALAMGLVDDIGYLSDALFVAKKIAKLSSRCKVIVYRRTEYANDNVYNPSTAQYGQAPSLLHVEPLSSLASIDTGFYYLWAPGLGSYSE
jgi:protease-4